NDCPRTRWTELDHVLDPEPPLEPNCLGKSGALVIGRQQEEVSDLAEVGRLPGLIDKAGQHALGFHAHPDIDLGRELCPNATGAGRRGALTDAAAIDPGPAAALLRQIERQAAPHDARAD